VSQDGAVSISQKSPSDLLKLNVNEHTEKKNNLTYLSWAWAWAEALKADASATFQVHTFADKPYMDVNGTAMVWVTVVMFGKPMTCMLPVMDYRNKCVTNPDAFAVNTSIMRCMTKALALHGLGLYIYAGEDLPEGEEKLSPDAQDAQKDIASLELFVNGIYEFIGHCKDEKDLVSFWKNNEAMLAELKAALPTKYEEVLAKFKQVKESFKEKK
jgi:hypothetical protein